MATPLEATCSTCEVHAEAVFRVEGMDCHEEVVILERRLRPLVGMEAISADVVGQRLHVKYDAARLDTSTMVDAIGQTGMRMWLEHEAPRNYGSDVRLRLYLMAASGLAAASGAALSALAFPRTAIAWYLAAAMLGGVFPARRALVALRTRSVDINVLMVVAVIGAVALGELLEAASVVFLFAVAQWLEARTLERARQAISALLDLAPRVAFVRRAGVEQQVPIEQVVVGDEVMVRPGDKLPVDGTVEHGHSDVNEAPITGESLPIDKTPGDGVYAGTINGRGALDIRVTRVGRDTRLSRITHLVEVAQSRRAPVQSFVDRFARIYTPCVIALAVFVGAVPPLFAGADASVWLYRAMVLLVIACPCALVISTPVSIVSALSAAARSGVLVKGGAFLERLAAIRVVAFDKTGTLTRGELHVDQVVGFGAATRGDVLRRAASVDARSEHPVARAIVEHARSVGIETSRVSGFSSVPGMGAEAWVDGVHVMVGSARFLASRGIAATPDAQLPADGSSVVLVAADGVAMGAIAIGDRPKDSAREAVDLLRSYGIQRIAMLTGDQATAARAVARIVGVDEHHAELLPEQKHEMVQRLRAAYGPVLMVGDGVNDAPALAAADVGVAMGAAGSDVALETADVALMSDELLKVPYAIRLARATLRNVKTNVAVSLILKAGFLIMAMTGSATLWMAVLADTGASVIVVANALRLLRTR
jgi:Zn2+/Cd2+-exporting ATPase